MRPLPVNSVSIGSVGRFSRSTFISTRADAAASSRCAAAAGESSAADGAGEAVDGAADADDGTLADAAPEGVADDDGTASDGDSATDGPGPTEHAARTTAESARSGRRARRLPAVTGGKSRRSTVDLHLGQATRTAALYVGSMPPLLVERVLIPDQTRSKLLVSTGPRPSLPTWSLPDPELNRTIREARERHGIQAPLLRIVRVIGDPLHGETNETLLEFDAPRDGWPPPAGFDWLPFDDVSATSVDAGPFAADIEAWLTELRSGETPPLRPAWARPGWLEATTDWLAGELRRHGRTIRGPVEQLSSWAISSSLAMETDSGRVVLKSVPALFGHEPALTQALARQHPGRVPNVLAIDVDRGHLLMEAFGGAQLGNEEPARWGEGLMAIAEVQQAWIGRREEAAALGVEDRTLGALGRELESIITDQQASPELDPDVRRRLLERQPHYRELIGRLQEGPVPETLVHGDFHPWNVQRDDGRLVIFDWSDACWGHPFFDVPTFTARTEDLGAREAMRSAFVSAWAAFGDTATLRALLTAAEILGELHYAISWRRLQAIFEPGVFPVVDTGVQRHLEYALAASEETETTR
jgi:hypothetical protein